MKNTISRSENLTPPSAELFIASGCAHCPTVMKALTDLLKKGLLGTLNISNIAVNNDRATKLNVRSVPWFSLSNTNSSMIFTGNYSEKEITTWVAAAKTQQGMSEYIESFLASGELMTIVQAIHLVPETFSSVIDMLADEETSIDIRIGLDALLENFTATKILQHYSTRLRKMASEDNIRLQIDALHYLALTADKENKEFIESKASYKDKQIQEAAIEALETLDDLIE